MTALSWIGSFWLALSNIVGPFFGYLAGRIGYGWMLTAAVLCCTLSMMFASLATEVGRKTVENNENEHFFDLRSPDLDLAFIPDARTFIGHWFLSCLVSMHQRASAMVLKEAWAGCRHCYLWIRFWWPGIQQPRPSSTQLCRISMGSSHCRVHLADTRWYHSSHRSPTQHTSQSQEPYQSWPIPQFPI